MLTHTYTLRHVQFSDLLLQMRPWEYLCHHSTQIKAVNRDPGGREESKNISLLFPSSPWPVCVCAQTRLAQVHISICFPVCVCVYEKCVKRWTKPISGGCVGAGQHARFTFSSSGWPLFLGKKNIYTLWMHGGQRLVYLLNNLGSWVAFSVMRRGRLTVCRRWLGVRSPGAFFTISASRARFPLRLSSSPYRQRTHRCHLCTHLWAYIHICKCSCTSPHAHSHIHTPAHFHPNELAVPHVHDIHPTPWIQFPCWWNSVYSINASKHTAARSIHYDTADEWLRRLCHAIIIVITAIIWPSFGHLTTGTCSLHTWQYLSVKPRRNELGNRRKLI